MKKIVFVVFFFFFLCGAFNLMAEQIPGSQYFYLGNGISFFPIGSSGVSYFTSMDSNYYNPASYADTRRITTDLTVGGLAGDNILLGVRGSFPTNYGVITGNALLLTSPSGNTAGDIYGIKGTFSKFISEEWLFGAAINAGYADGFENDFYTSLDLGTIYRKQVDGTGIGIFDYSLGVAFKNLGKNITYTGYDAFPPLEMDIGAKAEIVRKGIYKSRIGGHFAMPFNPFNTFFGVGLENIFIDMVNIKLGLNFGVEDVAPYSFGFDLNFDLEDTGIQVSYSLLPVEWGGQQQITHNAGISVAFGTYDKKPPETSVEIEDIYVSPNHDGVNDISKFDVNVKDNTMVFGWKLEITDEGGKPVKSYAAQDVRKIRYMTLGKYLRRIFAKKEEVQIPNVIEWDGEDVEGNIVEDGEYYYMMTAWDENNNQSVTDRKKIIVDTVVPMVDVKTQMLLFSPNNDGVKDTLSLTVQSENIASDDNVLIRILNRDRNEVLRSEQTGSAPSEFLWDGRDTSGALVPEGVYSFQIETSDKAGNKTASKVDGIIVKTEYEKVSASPTFRGFSPNGDGYFDINDIILFSSSKEGLIDWSLDIIDKNDRVVRSYGGKKDFPEIISFDGKDNNGKVLPDGLYTVQFRLNYESGNYPKAFYKFLKVDNTAPEIEISTDITAFSPNGDGVKDTVSILHKIKAGEGDEFEARLVNAAGAVFKTLDYGKKPPEVVVWDGMGDDNTQPVEGMYTYTITGKDEYGNETTRVIGPMKLATGFEQVSVEPSEYVFSPNNDGRKDTVSFKLNTNNLQGIVEWKLDIKDSVGKVIRSFNDRNMGLRLPSDILWEGLSDAKASVDDGIYTTVFSILYDTGNNPISKPKDVKIDTRAPAIEIYVDDLQISPNDDGAKETIIIFQKITGEEDDSYTAVITNAIGDVVKEFSWRGKVPSEIVWDGRDKEGNPLPEGIYNYSISGRDTSGNLSERRITGFVLTTTYEKISLVADREGISPNGDGVLDTVEFVPSFSSEKNLKSWYMDIYNNQGQRVRGIEGQIPVPTKLKWDGTDGSDTVVPDGIYYYKMGLMYNSGNHPSSETGKITVDNSPPEHKIIVSPKLFSPDGDGEADTLYITLEVIDRSGVTDWDISIYRKWNERIDRSAPFKKYSGKGNFKGTIRWDGYSDPLTMPTGFTIPDEYTYRQAGDERWVMLVDSASSYVVELTTKDVYNNGLSDLREFETDILVIPTPYGLKIMINSIQFEFDKAELLPQSFYILNRLIQIIEKFPNYKILIVGHTDWVGSEEYNQKLSERRAYAVYKYLVEHDVDKERLATEGRGESQPIDDNEIESGRARNRRVEFYLTKK